MFARLTQTVPKTEKTLKSLGFQGILVRETGLEPASAYCTHEPESCASANSAIPADRVWTGVDSNHRSR